MSTPSGAPESGDSVGKIVGFLREIGLTVHTTSIEEKTFLPGIHLEAGGLVVDVEKLLYPGDLLHEAGHLAVMLPADRATTEPSAGSDIGNEIAAQCWSYAAVVHLGLPPELVFHEQGYHGAAHSLIGMYRDGTAGVPLLQWMGLTRDPRSVIKHDGPAWPHMVRWLREEERPAAD